MFVTLAAIAGLALGGVLLAPGAASAADFAITTPDGTLFAGSTVTVTGTKALDGRVEIPSLTGGDPYCIEGSAIETFSCTFTLADGSWPVVVKQYPADTSQPTLEASVTIRVLGAPTIDGSDPLLTTGILSGTGFAGAGIVVSATGPESFSTLCTSVQRGGFWSCPMPVSASGDYSVTVQQVWEGSGEAGGSSTRAVTVDKQAPAIPVISKPAAGARLATQPTTYSGTGENGARVDVFVDSVLVCSGVVTGTAWSCTGSGVADGDRLVQAIQWDAAGNPSGVGPGVRVSFGAAPSGGGGTPPTTPTNPESPAEPAPDPSEPAPAPAPAPSPSQSATPAPAPSLPFFPPPVGGSSGLPPFDTWGTPTDYGAAIPPIMSAPWLWGLLIAIGFIALIALPLRLIAGTLRGRVEPRFARFAGRNRPADRDERPLFSPWTVAATALGAAILLAALAGGIQAEVRYLRLMIAIGIALVALNWLGVALVTRLASRAVGPATRIRLAPLFLGIAAVTALFSRGGGVQPPVIFGVVIAATFAVEAGVRSRGIVALVQFIAMTVLGFWAWLGHSALGPQEGFALSLASETLAALCVAALGSLVFLLLPVGRMPGNALFAWSWPAWLAVTLVAVTFAATVIATSASFPLMWLAAAAVIFTVVALATWSWIRYVEPQFADA